MFVDSLSGKLNRRAVSWHLESWIPLWNFETISVSLMRSTWLKLARLAQKNCTFYTFSCLMHCLLPKDNLFMKIFDCYLLNCAFVTKVTVFVCLFDSLRPINNISVKQGRVFLG